MSNPLLQKYEELYGKKEPPKIIKAKNPQTSLKTYDVNSVNVSFHQVVEKVKNGEAQVSSMSMEMDIMYGTKITFEVYVDT